LSWQTSKAFVSAKERIERIESIAPVKGIQTSGAISRYITKEDFPQLAGLTEGGFAVDIHLIMDHDNEKAMIFGVPGAGEASGNRDYLSDSGVYASGVLASGVSDGSAAALASLDDNDVIIFWYNGIWNIIKNVQGKEEYIPADLARSVIASTGENVERIMGKLSSEVLPGTDYESVDSRQIAKLLGMEEALYSRWSNEGVINIMLNTHMKDGPYQLKRTGQNIRITMYRQFSNQSSGTVKAIPGIEGNAAYYKCIDEGFKKWSGNYQASTYANFGDDKSVDVTVVTLDAANNKIPADVIIINSIDDGAHLSKVALPYGAYWKINNIGKMTIYNHEYIRNYSREEYINIASHEFGHLVGVGDAYGNPYEDNVGNNDETPGEDIMRGGGYISENDIEMVFLAALKNQKQYFYNDEKGGVIRIKSEAVTWGSK